MWSAAQEIGSVLRNPPGRGNLGPQASPHGSSPSTQAVAPPNTGCPPGRTAVVTAGSAPGSAPGMTAVGAVCLALAPDLGTRPCFGYGQNPPSILWAIVSDPQFFRIEDDRVSVDRPSIQSDRPQFLRIEGRGCIDGDRIGSRGGGIVLRAIHLDSGRSCTHGCCTQGSPQDLCVGFAAGLSRRAHF